MAPASKGALLNIHYYYLYKCGVDIDIKPPGVFYIITLPPSDDQYII